MQSLMGKELSENSGNGVYYKIDLTNHYEALSNVIENVIFNTPITDNFKRRDTKIMYFKCLTEAVVLYADVDHCVIDNYAIMEDIYNNIKIDNYYDFKDDLVIKQNVLYLAAILKHTWLPDSTDEFYAICKSYKDYLLDLTIEQHTDMSNSIDTLIKNILRSVFTNLVTTDGRRVHVEVGDDVQLVGWEENVSEYKWYEDNINPNVILTLKIVS